MPFSDLGLSPKVLQAVEEAGYTNPTPIQEQAIPHVVAGKDVLGIAQTGTGKTASFTLPMITRLERGRARARMPRTLILEPTRELAAQVEESFDKYGKNHKLSVALLIGGLSFGDQDAKLTKGVDVLIATPGRLLDHFERGRLLLTGIEVLVIDEADRMLDMGFIPDIERICKLIPPSRQTLFFSATMPSEIQRLVSQFLRDPVKIEVARASTTNSFIKQKLIPTSNEAASKRDTLRTLLRTAEDFKNAIIFCNRKRDVTIVHRSLQRHGFSAVTIHGDLDQRSRMAALDAFKTGEASLLVASDVAARGLDIPDVSHVLNFDVPIHPEDYVHRIGRTGRAGKTGTAFTLVSTADRKALSAIEKVIGNALEWQDGGLDSLPAAGSEGGEAKPARSGGRRKAAASRAEAPARDDVPQADAPARRERTRRGAKPAPAPEAMPEEKPAAAPSGRGGRPAQLRDMPEDNGSVPFGQSDQVPAFLLRPVRVAKA
jgi:superfamily II DNA/RNA helicase